MPPEESVDAEVEAWLDEGREALAKLPPESQARVREVVKKLLKRKALN